MLKLLSTLFKTPDLLGGQDPELQKQVRFFEQK